MIIRHNTTRGFTLLEMTVAVAVFSFVILIIFSALISLSHEARKTQANRTVIGNLGASIESMARSIRGGKEFVCFAGGVPSSFPTPISYNSVTGNISVPSEYTSYLGSESGGCRVKLSGQSVIGGSADGSSEGLGDYLAFVPIEPGVSFATLYRRNGTPDQMSIERSLDGGVTWERVTAPDVRIEKLKFYVSSRDTRRQPFITIVMSGYTNPNDPVGSRFDIQTTVAARTPNL